MSAYDRCKELIHEGMEHTSSFHFFNSCEVGQRKCQRGRADEIWGKSNWSVWGKRRVTQVFLPVRNPGVIFATLHKRGLEIPSAVVTTTPTTKARPSEAINERVASTALSAARLLEDGNFTTGCSEAPDWKPSLGRGVDPAPSSSPHKLGGRRPRHHSTSGTRPVLQPRPRGGFDVTGEEERWRTFLF